MHMRVIVGVVGILLAISVVHAVCDFGEGNNDGLTFFIDSDGDERFNSTHMPEYNGIDLIVYTCTRDGRLQNHTIPAPRCGDGIVHRWAGEECDDGTAADGGGCSATCQYEYCKVEQFECLIEDWDDWGSCYFVDYENSLTGVRFKMVDDEIDYASVNLELRNIEDQERLPLTSDGNLSVLYRNQTHLDEDGFLARDDLELLIQDSGTMSLEVDCDITCSQIASADSQDWLVLGEYFTRVSDSNLIDSVCCVYFEDPRPIQILVKNLDTGGVEVQS